MKSACYHQWAVVGILIFGVWLGCSRIVDAQTIISDATINSAVINKTVIDQCTGTTSAPTTIGQNCTATGLTAAFYAGTNVINGITYHYIAMPSGCAAPSFPVTTYYAPTCSSTDKTMAWSTGTYTTTLITPTAVSFQTAMVDGKTTTQQLASLSQTGGNYIRAASACDYMNYGGYEDWFLPSLGELNTVLYTNLCQQVSGSCTGSGSLVAGGYWSSSEVSASAALYEYFYNGGQYADAKTLNFYVRCVRRY